MTLPHVRHPRLLRPPPPCTSVSGIPPEGNSRCTSDLDCCSAQPESEPEAVQIDSYFDEQAQATCSLDESPTEPRFDARILELETRGVTQHIGRVNRHNRPLLKQGQLWRSQTIHKFTLAAKLRTVGATDLAASLEACHSTYTVATCCDCGSIKKFPNRCDRFFCPECQPRLAGERRRSIEWWAQRCQQPKHVVLTQRNLDHITPETIAQFRAAWNRLRRMVFARNWTGGFYSLEVTNEGRGWHLHLHALIDSRWIDAGLLSKAWHKATRGLGHIVKVQDARQKDYLKEVTKYAVKGNQLAAWTGDQSLEFIRAFDGARTFGVFGSLYGKRTEWREWLDSIQAAKPLCACGSCWIKDESEHDWLARDILNSAAVTNASDHRSPNRHARQPGRCSPFDYIFSAATRWTTSRRRQVWQRSARSPLHPEAPPRILAASPAD